MAELVLHLLQDMVEEVVVEQELSEVLVQVQLEEMVVMELLHQ
jgi:hypothetical protein